MKKLKFLPFVLILGLAVLASCDDDDDPKPTAEEIQTALLVGTWNNSSVTYDGATDAGDWSAFKVVLGDGTYTSSAVSTGREKVWPAQGTWAYDGAGTDNVNVNKLIRDDGVEIAITVSETALKMTFTYDEDIHGKNDGIDGAWVFNMTK